MKRSVPAVHLDLSTFPERDRYTVSGHLVGDICFECECRVSEIGGDDGIILAWCDCALPEDHHEMEVVVFPRSESRRAE